MEKEKAEIRMRRIVRELLRISDGERCLQEEVRQIKQQLLRRKEEMRRLLKRRKARQGRISEMLSSLRVPCIIFNGEHVDLWYNPNDGTGERRIDLVGFDRRNELRELFARDWCLFVLFLAAQGFIPGEGRYLFKWWDCVNEEWHSAWVEAWRNKRKRSFAIVLS